MNVFAQTGPGSFPAAADPDSRLAAWLGHWTVAFVALLCVAAPVITITSALPWFRPEQLALIPIALVYAWLLLAGMARPIRWEGGLYAVAAIYCGCILLSLWWGTSVLGHPLMIRDFYELPKALLPVAFFTLGLEANLTEAAMRRMLNYFSLGTLFACVYAWAQWFDPAITQPLVPIYSGGAHDEGALAHYRRVYSTMGNPNELGQLMTWATAIFTLAALYRVGNRKQNILLAFASLVTLAMTGSRYGLLNTGLVIVLIFFISAVDPCQRRSLITALLILVPVFGATFTLVARSNQATIARFETLSDPYTTDSFQDRINSTWPDAEQAFLISPALGNGPAKDVFSDVFTDSEYLDVLKEFGVVGTIAYLAFFLYPLGPLWRALKQRRNCHSKWERKFPGTFWALQVSFIMLITALVMNIGMSTFYAASLQGFLWLWLGIGVGAARAITTLPVEANVRRHNS